MNYVNFKGKKLTDNEIYFVEKIFIPAMGQKNLEYLHPQFELKEKDGKFRLVDFVFIKGSRRFAIEVDSYPYHADSKISRTKFNDERRRQNFLTSKGYEILRYTCDQIYKDSAYCINDIKDRLFEEIPSVSKKSILIVSLIILIPLVIISSSYFIANRFSTSQESVDVKSLPLISFPEGIKEINNYIDKYVRIKGTIYNTYRDKRSNTIFLDFISFKCVIFKNSLHNFIRHPEEYYRFKKVEVWGKIKTYKGGPEIILNYQNQIKIIE